MTLDPSPNREAAAVDAPAAGAAAGTARPPLLPSRRELLDPRAPFLIPLLLLIATRAWFWHQLPFACEDAYITFRYARNLAIGWGLVYNPGEAVMGFSSPLWTLWNALGFFLTRDPVLWSRIWTVLADVATLVLMGGLLTRHASRAAAWCFTVFFATWTYFAAVAMSGMENSTMLALIVLSAALVARGSRASGLALAALALVRPEGLVAAGIVGFTARRRDQLVAASLTAIGITSLLAYFGSAIPQSVTAKASIYGTPGLLAGRHWWEWISPMPLGSWPGTTEGSILFAMAVLLAPAAVLGAAALWRDRRSPLAGAVAAMAAVWVGYSVMGVAYFFWYLLVPLAGIAALAAIGLPRLVRGRAAYASLALFIAGTWTIAPDLYRARAYAEAQGFGAVAEYLAGQGQPGQKVMLEPIGMIGWRCPMYVVDEVGLVSPAVADRRLDGAGWMADVVATERPDWLVVRRGVIESARGYAGAGEPFRSPAERDRLLDQYALVTIVHQEAGDQALAVLGRRN